MVPLASADGFVFPADGLGNTADDSNTVGDAFASLIGDSLLLLHLHAHGERGRSASCHAEIRKGPFYKGFAGSVPIGSFRWLSMGHGKRKKSPPEAKSKSTVDSARPNR